MSTTDVLPVENVVQQHVVNFTKVLPKYVQDWRNVLQESVLPLEALANKAEQLRCVEKANVGHVEDFENVKSDLVFNILNGIEEELCIIQDLVDKLHKLNQLLKNKLSLLENSTVGLDWEQNIPLLNGSHVQPALSTLLQEALQFWMFFSSALGKIGASFKNVDIRKEKSVNALKDSFSIDLDDKSVRFLLLITQYINNESAVC